MELRKVFSGKKIFLTGHTGFKGAWMLKWLHMLGAEVKGYSLAPENSTDLYVAMNGDNLCNSIIGDIRDSKKLKYEVLSFQPDYVFHFAAQPLVRLSYAIPINTFEINAIGTANLLDAMHNLDKQCIAVMITTDKVYKNREIKYCYKEDDILGGYDPYSASKACAEIIIDCYRSSFFNSKNYKDHKKSISVARAGNVIGGGDWAKDRIIPDIIRALSLGKSVEVRNPNAIRPWQHVLEPLHGYLMLAVHQTVAPITFSDRYNFGPFKEDILRVEQLVEEAIKVWGSGSIMKTAKQEEPHEATLLQLNIDKATSKLNWKPKMNSKTAIRKSIQWYKDYLRGEETASYLMEADIREFCLH